jgi:protein-L-isoaspartate(D-aspartate) O-methyltransferase
MTAVNIEQAKFNMIEQQVRPWDVLDPKILETLDQVPRDAYVADEYKNLAFADTGIPLGNGQCMMHPIVEGRLLQALDLQQMDEVLEIGTGSGFVTACLAHLASHVDTLDIDESLTKAAAARFVEQGIFNVSISTGDAMQGDEPSKTYDAIAITGSVAEIPEVYKKALNVGGRMFVIVGEDPVMVAWLITRVDENSWAEQYLFETSIEPLVNAEPVKTFQF